VGLILCQWAKALGARVIGVVGSEAKAQLARKHGCWRVLISGQDELTAGVKALTKGAGVAAVYDAVGKDTFMESLDCVRRLGIMVSYGNASGPPPAISPLELTKRGSLFLTRPSLFNYIATREELAAGARELFAAVKSKKLRVVIGQRYPLTPPMRTATSSRDHRLHSAPPQCAGAASVPACCSVTLTESPSELRSAAVVDALEHAVDGEIPALQCAQPPSTLLNDRCAALQK
jgi:hypothetical protein